MSGSRPFSDDPGKRAAERWYLIYTPIWGAVSAVVMTSGLGVYWSQQAWGDLAFLLFGLLLWMGVLLGGYGFRAAEDAGRPWYRLYHTKFQIWMFVFAFLGNYFTEYFYEVLHMQYGFETKWNLNHVPFFLYMVTVAYFSTYGTLINVFRRFTESWLPASAPRWARAASFLPACFVVAGLETTLNANPYTKSLFCYDDMPFMLWFGTLTYGMWFAVTAPFWFPIDERRGEDTPVGSVWLSALAGFMLVIVVNELIRSAIAPHFTGVQRGAVGMDNFGTSCLAPKAPAALAARGGAGIGRSPLAGGRHVEILGQIGGAAFTLVSLLVGVRLVGLWLRTRQLPELLIGCGMLLLAGLGYPLSAVARGLPEASEGLRAGLGALAGGMAAIGLSTSTAFTWVLFRHDAAWARVLFASVTLFALGLFAAETLDGSWASGGALFWGWLPFGVSVGYGWGFVECARYHGMLRRRLHLGLADPLVADRFRLYATATGLAVTVNVVGQVFWWLHLEMLTHPVGSLLLAVLGTGSSVLMWLAFLPPRVYLERVRGRAETAGSVEALR